MCVLVLVNKSARVFFFDMRKTNWRFRYKNFPLGKNMRMWCALESRVGNKDADMGEEEGDKVQGEVEITLRVDQVQISGDPIDE